LWHGRRPPTGVKAWTLKYLEWVKREVHFEQMAQEATLLDYLHEVEHAAARIARLDGTITEAVKGAPPQMRAVIAALQALRGIAHISAVTVVAELGELSRFARATQLMAYGGIVASENSSGERTRRGNITKTGNAHLRRVVVEAAWAYRHRPAVGATLRKRQETVSEEIKEISWKAQQRLHERYRKLLARGKNKGVVVTAVGRELLGFIWAIGIQVETAQKESQQRAA
jgi:transposase